MSDQDQASSISRRGWLAGAAILASGVAAGGSAAAADSAKKPIKLVSFLARKKDDTLESFLKHWKDVHAPLAHKIPGIARYTLTIIKSSSTRTDGPAAMNIQVDGIAEVWFDDQKSLEAAVATPEFAALRADGAAFIGSEIDFVTDEVVIIPRPA